MQIDEVTRHGQEMTVRAHPLVFPQYVPDWLRNGQFNREHLIETMHEHIEQMMTHLEGTAQQWVVVNEPYLPPYREDDVFQRGIGDDYIELAFEKARQTDQKAILIYNDTDNHRASGITTQLTATILERLKGRDLVDGVGLQMHIDGSSPPGKDDMVNTMTGYGLPVYVTELDVDMSNVPGSQEERFARQAEIYREMFEACLDSQVCRGVTFWEAGDQYSWYEKFLGRPNADATLYDDNLDPKPAYHAIREVLIDRVRNLSSN